MSERTKNTPITFLTVADAEAEDAHLGAAIAACTDPDDIQRLDDRRINVQHQIRVLKLRERAAENAARKKREAEAVARMRQRRAQRNAASRMLSRQVREFQEYLAQGGVLLAAIDASVGEIVSFTEAEELARTREQLSRGLLEFAHAVAYAWKDFSGVAGAPQLRDLKPRWGEATAWHDRWFKGKEPGLEPEAASDDAPEAA